ncbi:Kelch domain-containing protein 2 [Chelonia mydas]|uniref:Kelch domain-containing protein 2 n=1 Tax=Chelonia mydas TaxID=8469 RepID=M7B236_CHEMY|nr:Kelch domain-containing protein 2 [Chelonia mydas]
MADDNEELQADEELPAPAEDNFEQLENSSPAERSGHVAVTDGHCMFVWGGYKNAQVRGFYDFYLPRDEIWIYSMETGRWLIFFGGYGYSPEGIPIGTFEFDETSFWDSRMNDLYHLNLDTWEWNEILVLYQNEERKRSRLELTGESTYRSRLWHTACASEEGEVIVFGGCANNLLAHHKAPPIVKRISLSSVTKTFNATGKFHCV